jgi:hypothetical protein
MCTIDEDTQQRGGCSIRCGCVAKMVEMCG